MTVEQMIQICYNESVGKGIRMSKKLTRDTKNQKLAGICAGLAKYFNVDPTLVRVLWIILGLAAGSGVLAYLICWFIMPEEGTIQDEN